MIIDIDGTADPTHGAQQLSMFNRIRPVWVALRAPEKEEGKTQNGNGAVEFQAG